MGAVLSSKWHGRSHEQWGGKSSFSLQEGTPERKVEPLHHQHGEGLDNVISSKDISKVNL